MSNKNLDFVPRWVLVVEDNTDAADSLAMLLRLAGHQVRTAYDGPTALEAALEQQPDVVLLDIALPKMDGYEIARRLREQPATKDTLIIGVTGYGRECDLEQSIEAGFDLHLVKPVDPERLLDLLSGDVQHLIGTRP